MLKEEAKKRQASTRFGSDGHGRTTNTSTSGEAAGKLVGVGEATVRRAAVVKDKDPDAFNYPRNLVGRHQLIR